MDVRRSLRAAAPFEDLALRARLDWPGGGAMVRLHVAVSAEGNARPVEVVEALWDADVAAGTDFARLALWAASDAAARVDPLDVPALRRRPPAAGGVGLAAPPAP